jgi:hypothetical protein
MTHDWLSLMSPVDVVGASLAGLENCREVSLFPTVSCWRRPENRLTRLLSCVGMSKLLEWFLLFLATMASSHAEDRRLAKDGGEVRIQLVYAYYTAGLSGAAGRYSGGPSPSGSSYRAADVFGAPDPGPLCSTNMRFSHAHVRPPRRRNLLGLRARDERGFRHSGRT